MKRGGRRVQVRVGPSRDDAHDIVYFRRHVEDDSGRSSPARDFLDSCPGSIRAKLRNVLIAVAAAPPRKFAGGGYWEAMHGNISGWFEVRRDGPQRRHYRLFCRIDLEAKGADHPWLVVIDGREKTFKTTLADSEYKAIRALGVEYFSRNPRSIYEPEPD